MKRSVLFSFFAILACIAISNAQNSCDNLVSNGDFQAGNTGFTSGLALACNACTAGTYCVTSNFTGKCSGWPSFFDHTFGNSTGSFLAIDGSTGAASGVWSDSGIPVVPGVTYEFSFFVSTVFGPAQQQFDLGMLINNINVSTINISQVPGVWTKYTTTWTCPVGVTSIPLQIRQLTPGDFRDFGIDDISFRCISCEADFAINHVDDCGLVSFADQSYGQSPIFHFWNFDDPGSGSNNTSNSMNPTHQFTECRSFVVCLTITTANGCVSEKCETVVVSDTIPPIALCLGVGLEMGSNCQATVTPALIDGGSSDNCFIQSMSVSPSIITACGEFPLTLTVTDWCGNSSTCQTTVQTAEVIPPVITCPSDILVHCDDDADPSNTGFATATDNCTSVPIMSYSDQISGLVPCDATIFRTWTATDSCGNEASCLQQIIIIDNIPPIISNCPPDISVIGSFNNGVCEANVTIGIPFASDNCDTNVSLINDYNSQLDASGIYQSGSTLINWTATDDCGNTASCSVSVTVECIDSCVCSNEVMLEQNGVSQILSCTQGSLVPVLSCPVSDVWISGFFGCVKSLSGEFCEDTQVNWTLNGPGNSLLNSGVTSEWFQLVFPVALIGAPGTYSLTMSTLCPGAVDSCTCTFYWIQQNCSPPCPNNLVPNPDFESYTTCPTGSFQLPTLSWTSPSTASPDYYNSCAAAGTGVSTPINDFGNQSPRSGAGYVGLIMRPINNYREYIETQLTAPLIANQVYQVSFYVNLADNSQWAVDEIGAYLSIGSVGPVPLAPVLNYIPQIKNPAGFVITDKNNWTLISGTYTAAGGEDHIIIGNFSNNSATTTMMGLGGLYPTSYYYIEDVEICEIPPAPCLNNIVQNSGFFLGAAPGDLGNGGQSMFWQTESGSPQVAASDFCGDPFSIQMHTAESICQTGFNFQQGHTYRLSFCGRFWEDPNQPTSDINFEFIGSNGCNGSNLETIGVSAAISNQSWATYTIPNWIASQSLNTLIIRAFNINGQAFGRIDNICIEEVLPDTCVCGGFTDMFIRAPQGALSQPITCNNITPVQLNCTGPGSSYNISGLFQCNGINCPPVTNVQWVLTGPAPSQTGSAGTNPYFNIQLLPTYFPIPGNYSLALSGICGNDTCTCVLNFVIDCPDLCPCDVQGLSNAVDQGFAVVKYPTSCKACFVPIALSDCDAVEWHLNTSNGPLMGTSAGNNAICYTFPGAGTYTVVMIVTRRKSDGTICEVFTKSQTVSLTCLIIADCTESRFPNPTFKLGAIGGGMLSGGSVDGWEAANGEPVVVEGSSGSFDAWSIQLSGNFDTSDVLTSLEPICIEKAEGMFSFRMAAKKHPDNEGKRERPCDALRVAGHGWTSSVPASGQLAFIPLDLLDSTEWVEVEVPFDLSTRTEFETCSTSNNGVFIQAVISVTNALGNDQGGEDTYSYAQLDNFCFNGTLITAIHDQGLKPSIRIYPNPNSGAFTVDLGHSLPSGISFSILSITGQMMMQQVAEPGTTKQWIDAENLPSGLYFIEVIQNGKIIDVQKLVKH